MSSQNPVPATPRATAVLQHLYRGATVHLVHKHSDASTTYTIQDDAIHAHYGTPCYHTDENTLFEKINSDDWETRIETA